MLTVWFDDEDDERSALNSWSWLKRDNRNLPSYNQKTV